MLIPSDKVKACIILWVVLCFKYTAPKTEDAADVFDKLSLAGNVGIAVSKDTTEPFRHVSVALLMDGKISHIISRRIEDKSLYLVVALFGSKAVTTIERVTAEKARQLRLTLVWETTNVTDAGLKIKTILSDEATRFVIWTKNCRDHVITTLTKALGNESSVFVSKEKFSHFFVELHVEDQLRCVIIFTASLLLVYLCLCYNSACQKAARFTYFKKECGTQECRTMFDLFI